MQRCRVKGGERARSGGERATSGGERARSGGERARSGGEWARSGGEWSRSGWKNPGEEELMNLYQLALGERGSNDTFAISLNRAHPNLLYDT